MKSVRTNSTGPDENTRRPTQFGLRQALGLVGLLSLWLTALTEPLMFEIALLATYLLLQVHWWRRRRWVLIGVAASVPLAIGALSSPRILSDPGLPTAEVKLDLIYSSFIVGIIIALASCGFIAALLRRRFVVVSVMAATLCAASVAMHVYSVKYYHLNRIDFRWQVPAGGSLRVESLRGVGRIYMHWKHARAQTSTNHFRTGETDVFGQGGRVRGWRAFLTYLRSARDEGDHFFGRSLALQLPYWMLAVASGLLVVPWRRLLPDADNRTATSKQ